MNYPQLFEALMIISFGLSWPTNILKSWKVRTAKGKSILFLYLVLFGYIFGILAKVIAFNVNYVLIFYIVNTIMVSIDIVLYYRNSKFDKLSEK